MIPFAERFRPSSWDHFVGQEQWLQPDGVIRRSIHKGVPHNIVVYGPPGCGKTSFAKLYMKAFSCHSVEMHPSKLHLQDVKTLLDEIERSPFLRPTIVWIDEIHRLTRPQQDVFLKAVEEGDIVLVAATTDNPSFVLSHALLSRVTVISFASLAEDNLHKLVSRVLQAYPTISCQDDALSLIISWASGDARKLLSILESLVDGVKDKHYVIDDITPILSSHVGPITAHGEGRYLLISALHKSIRGSDCNAAMYWIYRLFHAGEDPRYIGRRLIRMAIEDIGLADPQALGYALHGLQCFETLGSPEGELALVEVAVYLALSPKSASCYTGGFAAQEVVQRTAHIPPPSHIINAPTAWMRAQGVGEGYIWDHDTPRGCAGQEFFPQDVKERSFYKPVSRGFERELLKRKDYFQKIKDGEIPQ